MNRIQRYSQYDFLTLYAALLSAVLLALIFDKWYFSQLRPPRIASWSTLKIRTNTSPLRNNSFNYFQSIVEPKKTSVTELLNGADRLVNSDPHNKGFVILTIAASNYRPVVENWMNHLKALNITNYIVMCVDRELYDGLDPAHAVLMTPSFSLNLSHSVASVFSKNKVSNKRTAVARSTSSSLSLARDMPRTAAALNRKPRQKASKRARAAETGGGVPDRTRKLKMKRKSSHRKKIDAKHNFSSSSASKNKTRSTSIWTSQELMSKRIDEIGQTDGFSVLMVIKHAAILALLKAGHSVVWSDVDCVWLKPCAVAQLQGLVDNSRWKSLAAVDIAGQQGLFPYEMSSVIGTALCTGFFLVNPTPVSQRIIQLVKTRLIYSIGLSKGKGDQKTMNAVLFEQGDLRRLSDSDKVNYGPSSSSGNKQQLYLHMHLKPQSPPPPGITLPTPAFKYSAPLKHAVNINASHNFVVAFLPYELFPRGDARADNADADNSGTLLPNPFTYKSLLSTLEGIYRTRNNNEANDEKMGMSLKRNMSDIVVQKKNMDEWAALKESACIWHMYSTKVGQVKVSSMQRDGVFADEDDD